MKQTITTYSKIITSSFHDDDTNSIDNILSSLSFSILFYEFCAIILIDVLAKLQYYLLDAVKTNTVVCSPFIPPPITI